MYWVTADTDDGCELLSGRAPKLFDVKLDHLNIRLNARKHTVDLSELFLELAQ